MGAIAPGDMEQRLISARAERKGRKTVEKKVSTLQVIEVEYVHVNDLLPNEYNPNRQSDHEFELLVGSMEEDGFTVPILINYDNVIIDGEHRWRAAKVLGIEEIPTVRAELSKAQMRISTIRHNRARGSHDLQLEAQVLRDLEELGALTWAKDSLMMSDAEVKRLLDDVPAPEALMDDEFSEAWVPDTFTDEEAELIRRGVQTTQAQIHDYDEGGQTVAAMSAQAIELTRRREHLIKRAKTEEERKQAMKEAAIYRVNLIFSGAEAGVIKKVLGDHPTERLLELCRAQMVN